MKLDRIRLRQIRMPLVHFFETSFGRVYDQQQWVHNFGFSALADRVPPDQTTPWKLYTWMFNHPPPAATDRQPRSEKRLFERSNTIAPK